MVQEIRDSFHFFLDGECMHSLLRGIALRIAAPLNHLYDLTKKDYLKDIKKDTTSHLYHGFQKILKDFDMDVNIFYLPQWDNDIESKLKEVKAALATLMTSEGINILIHKSVLDSTANWSVHDIWHKTFDSYGYIGDTGSLSTHGQEPFAEMIKAWENSCALLNESTKNELGGFSGIDIWPFLIQDQEILEQLPAYNVNKSALDTMADLGVVFFLTNGNPSKVPDLKYDGGLYLDPDTGEVTATNTGVNLSPLNPYLPESNKIFRDMIKTAFSDLRSYMESRKGDWIWFTT